VDGLEATKFKTILGRRYLQPGETINILAGIIDRRIMVEGEELDSEEQYEVTIILGNVGMRQETVSIVDQFQNMIKEILP
jgi:hypothetical protein